MLPVLAACAGGAPQSGSGPAEPAKIALAVPESMQPFSQEIPGAGYQIVFQPVPGSADGKIAPFWLAKTETTWEAFDAFTYGFDQDQEKQTNDPADAVTRPTKPYLPPDRGFGHEGYAAISIGFATAQNYCQWLALKTGRRFRLPTEAEWEHACRAGGGPGLREAAWYGANSDDKPHPVASKPANAHGIHDLLGNVGEWCVVPGDQPVLKGGHFATDAAGTTASARLPEIEAWNKRDPQLPKGKWWLSDGPFVGFRILCESPETKK